MHQKVVRIFHLYNWNMELEWVILSFFSCWWWVLPFYLILYKYALNISLLLLQFNDILRISYKLSILFDCKFMIRSILIKIHNFAIPIWNPVSLFEINQLIYLINFWYDFVIKSLNSFLCIMDTAHSSEFMSIFAEYLNHD